MGTKSVTKKRAKKASTRASTKKAANEPADVAGTRETVPHVIAQHAGKMTEALAAEAEKGHLPAFKYLFELLGIHPAPAVEQAEAEDSNDLARVLLNRFDFPYKGPGDEEQEGAAKDETAKQEELVPAGASEDSVD
jgi:hypothetical protein